MGVVCAVLVWDCHLTFGRGWEEIKGVLKEILTTLLYGYCPTTGWFLRQAGAALMTVSWVYVSHDYSPTNTSGGLVLFRVDHDHLNEVLFSSQVSIMYISCAEFRILNEILSSWNEKQ